MLMEKNSFVPILVCLYQSPLMLTAENIMVRARKLTF